MYHCTRALSVLAISLCEEYRQQQRLQEVEEQQAQAANVDGYARMYLLKRFLVPRVASEKSVPCRAREEGVGE